MLATLRKKLKGVSIRNRSLQDILLTCSRARRVISVESHPTGIHNTKLIVELPDGKRRVHFYSRLNLATLLEGVELTSTVIGDVISELNLKGFDFTEDDLELVDRILTAKPTSLGYVGALDNVAGPREISCDGATADAIIMVLVHESVTEDEFMNTMSSAQVEMNDQVYGTSEEEPEFLNRHVRIEGYRENLTPDQLALVPEGWFLFEAIRFSNLTSNPLRMKYGFLEMVTEKIKFTPLETVNPTSYNEETGAAAFCLAPQELVCKPELCYGITIDNWAETEEQYQIIYDAIDHIRNTFEAEDPNANSVYVSYGSELDENNSVLTAYIRIWFEYRYSSNPPPNGLGGSFKVKFQLPAVDSYSDWYEYDVDYGDNGAEYTLVSELGTASYARDIDACLIQTISAPLS